MKQKRKLIGYSVPAAALLCSTLYGVTGCGSGDTGKKENVGSTELALSDAKTNTNGTQHYTLFEDGAVRPIAVLPGGTVAVTNIPDDRIELFRPTGHGANHCGSVNVGMRPVALSMVGDKLWVVNHLSDSVSVVDVDEWNCTGQVERTLSVGDEPRDVVSARSSSGERYAFVTVAHRGQNVKDAAGNYRDPQLTTPGLGRADVFVYRADHLGALNAEKPATVLTLFTDSPRALAVAKDKVYAAGFLSGNQTSIVRYTLIVDRGRQSLAKLDADGDMQIDASLPPEARIIEGGYPAIKGHGRCVNATLSTPNTPGADRDDFWMDTCVQTDPADPRHAIKIIPQNTGVISPECSCNDSKGEMQITGPMIVRFFDSPAVCGANFRASLGGCWLEPPQDPADLPGPGATKPLLVQEWNDAVNLALPDKDVFTIDLNQDPPKLVPAGEFRHVGTTLFSMAVHPKDGKVFVANTDARNLVRFEGPGAGVPQSDGFASTSVRGHIAESRITVLDPSNGSVKPVHLNGHIDYSKCCAEGPNNETERSLAFPVGLAMTNKRDWRGRILDNQDLYVAALGSDKVAVLSTDLLEHASSSIIPDARDHIEVPGGPMGLVLDEERDRVYVLARFTNELVTIDTHTRHIIDREKMFSPEPKSIVDGRPFLYDARRTSSHGDTACASCHIFGDFDGLSWDLGAPNDADFANTGPFFAHPEFTSAPLVSRFLAVKGPMSTQSLRGLANHGPMHWRGDRRGGKTSTDNAQPDTGSFDENAAFNAFNVAFGGLNGRGSDLTDEDMQKFTNFILQVTYPPNPIRRLDNDLTDAQKRARSRYFGCDITDASFAMGQCADGRNIKEETHACNCANPPEFQLGLLPRPADCPANPVCTLSVSDFQNTCNGCHTLDAHANEEFGVAKPGLFGTNSFYTNDNVSHVMKIPHLRNAYQKVGMFGSVQTKRGIGLTNLADSIFGPREGGLLSAQNAFTGDQIRGFGFTHAGEEDTMFHFFSASGFARAPAPGFPLINPNSDGFETTLPHDTTTCFGTQLGTLNNQFLAQLGTADAVNQLRQNVLVLTNTASTPADKAAATAAIGAFIGALPASNPGSVFQRLPLASAAGQLSLPLLACPSLPPVATLQALGCFDLATGPGCAPLVSAVKGCALWGATLEVILPNGTKACHAGGLDDKPDMEEFVFAYESNMKPIVGQQVTLDDDSGAAAHARLDLLVQQATAGNCDLVAHTRNSGFVFTSGGFERDDGRMFTTDRFNDKVVGHDRVTFTAVPPGEGVREGVDRDEDGRLDQLDHH